MSLAPHEQQQIAAIWGADEREERTALVVTVSRTGRVTIIDDHDLIAPIASVVIGDLLTRIAAKEQARRRQEAHAS